MAKLKRATKVDCNCILDDFLYLGSIRALKNIEYLQDLGITHIISLAGKINVNNEFIVHVCHINDNKDTNIIQLFDSIFNIFNYLDNINQKKKSKGKSNNKKIIKYKKNKKNIILIHCLAGMSRSASVVIGYLMYQYKLSLMESFQHVYNKRNCINPNIGFLQQLFKYENELFGQNSIDKNELKNIKKLCKNNKNSKSKLDNNI